MEDAAQEHLVDRLIREAIESGEFDHLPGVGKPIPGAGTVDDEYWWVRDWVKRNRTAEEDQTSSSST